MKMKGTRLFLKIIPEKEKEINQWLSI